MLPVGLCSMSAAKVMVAIVPATTQELFGVSSWYLSNNYPFWPFTREWLCILQPALTHLLEADREGGGRGGGEAVRPDSLKTACVYSTRLKGLLVRVINTAIYTVASYKQQLS